MTWKDYWDNPEELMIGSLLQFPLYFIIGWKILLVIPICGLLWRWGGVKDGAKIARRLGVPLVVCVSSMFFGVSWPILLAVPFMVWLAPSYGVDSWLFKLIRNDFITRLVCFSWYWLMFSLAYCIRW